MFLLSSVMNFQPPGASDPIMFPDMARWLGLVCLGIPTGCVFGIIAIALIVFFSQSRIGLIFVKITVGYTVVLAITYFCYVGVISAFLFFPMLIPLIPASLAFMIHFLRGIRKSQDADKILE